MQSTKPRHKGNRLTWWISSTLILRRYFLDDRKLLSEPSRCGWAALKTFYTSGIRGLAWVLPR